MLLLRQWRNDAILRHVVLVKSPAHLARTLAFVAPHMWLPYISDLNQIDYGAKFMDKCKKTYAQYISPQCKRLEQRLIDTRACHKRTSTKLLLFSIIPEWCLSLSRTDLTAFSVYQQPVEQRRKPLSVYMYEKVKDIILDICSIMALKLTSYFSSRS